MTPQVEQIKDIKDTQQLLGFVSCFEKLLWQHVEEARAGRVRAIQAFFPTQQNSEISDTPSIQVHYRTRKRKTRPHSKPHSKPSSLPQKLSSSLAQPAQTIQKPNSLLFTTQLWEHTDSLNPIALMRGDVRRDSEELELNDNGLEQWKHPT